MTFIHGEDRDPWSVGDREAEFPLGQLYCRAAWMRGEHALLGALIEEAQPVDAADGQLTVAFAASAPFLKKKAEDPANRAAVTAALGNVTGGRWRLSYELRGELDAREREQPAASSEEEWVRRFMEEFDAEELPPTGAVPGAVPVGENGAERAGDEEKGA